MTQIIMLRILVAACVLINAGQNIAMNINDETFQNMNVPLLNPFHIDFDPMERLLLVNIEQDPDSLYIGFEPQVFHNTKQGSGHLVIGWRKDGRVDVYHQESLTPAAQKYDIAGKGLANMIPVKMSEAHFEVTETGVQARYAFHDLHGRQILLQVVENNPRRRKPFGLLAPMGSAAENPSAMPLILLHDFYFVRRKHTDIQINIDGRAHKPDVLPIPMDFQRMYFARYSPRPLIITLNPAFDGKLPVLRVLAGQNQISHDATELSLSWSDGVPRIDQITHQNPVQPLSLRFRPAFPNLHHMQNGQVVQGRFEIEGDHSTGRIIGQYRVEKTEQGVLLNMNPDRGWKPRPNKLSLRFLYAVNSLFKRWPKAYHWQASLVPPGPDAVPEENAGDWHMQSSWIKD